MTEHDQTHHPAPLPYHQSRPGLDDDLMLSTGQPVSSGTSPLVTPDAKAPADPASPPLTDPHTQSDDVDSDDLPAPSAHDGTRQPHPIPHQQSRPGPDDDVMLSTGRPVNPAARQRPATDRGTRTSGARTPRGYQTRGRKAWVPGQHGAWSMLILPPIVGWVVGGVSWKNLLLLPAWWGAYLTYWAWSQWLRTRSPQRRLLLLLPLAVYTGWTAVLGALTLIAAPYLVQFAIPLIPLFAIALWEVRSGRDRSLRSGLSTTAAASLMAAVTYSLAVGGAGGLLGTAALTGPAAQALPGASPNGQLAGWSWMWLVTALTAAYFCGTVPYIKSMIRGRFNRPLLAGTVVAHAVVATATVWLAGGGYLPVAHAALWVALAVRSLVMPLWQWHQLRTHARPLRPGTMGVVEVVFCVLFLLTVASW